MGETRSAGAIGVLRRFALPLLAVQMIVTLAACGSDPSSDPGGESVTWSLHSGPPVIVTITDGPWTLAQLAPGNPNPPNVPNRSYGYGANFATANDGQTSPMEPFYFPFTTGSGANIQGYFDWRAKDINEAIVAASSSDGGMTWQFQQTAWILTQAVPINAQSANPDQSIADNGFGHETVIHIPAPAATPIESPMPASRPTPTYAPHPITLLYTLDRSAGAVDKFGLIVTQIAPADDMPLNGVPTNIPYVGEFTDETKVVRTNGLINPDGILAVVPRTFPVEILYIQKIRNGDASGSTALPPGAQCQVQPYVPPGESSPSPPNHDIVNVRLATTEDGVNFADHGVVLGLNDLTTTSFVGTRYVAPNGTLLDLGSGRYGLFFGAGNCMDADSDAFHYIGYAENLNAYDPTTWTVINGIDNPIVSILPRTLPVNGVQTLIPAEPALVGPTLESYAARVYTPAVTVFDKRTVTMIFGGYHVYNEKDDYAEYRAIHFVQLDASRDIPLDAKAD